MLSAASVKHLLFQSYQYQSGRETATKVWQFQGYHSQAVSEVSSISFQSCSSARVACLERFGKAAGAQAQWASSVQAVASRHLKSYRSSADIALDTWGNISSTWLCLPIASGLFKPEVASIYSFQYSPSVWTNITGMQKGTSSLQQLMLLSRVGMDDMDVACGGRVARFDIRKAQALTCCSKRGCRQGDLHQPGHRRQLWWSTAEDSETAAQRFTLSRLSPSTRYVPICFRICYLAEAAWRERGRSATWSMCTLAPRDASRPSGFRLISGRSSQQHRHRVLHSNARHDSARCSRWPSCRCAFEASLRAPSIESPWKRS